MLFTCVESLQENHDLVLAHLNSGLNIFSEFQAKEGQRSSNDALVYPAHLFISIESLAVLYTRLNTHALELGQTQPPQILSSTLSKMPEPFSTLEEAKNALDAHWNSASHNLQSAGELPDQLQSRPFASLVAQQENYKRLLRQWSRAFSAFLQHPNTKLNEKAQRDVTVLKIHHKVAEIMLSFDERIRETSFDRFLPEFSHIVSLAESLIAKVSSTGRIPPSTGNGRQKAPFSLSMGMGLIEPLYIVAHRCRNPFVRRRAMSLLLSSPHLTEKAYGTVC